MLLLPRPLRAHTATARPARASPQHARATRSHNSNSPDLRRSLKAHTRRAPLDVATQFFLRDSRAHPSPLPAPTRRARPPTPHDRLQLAGLFSSWARRERQRCVRRARGAGGRASMARELERKRGPPRAAPARPQSARCGLLGIKRTKRSGCRVGGWLARWGPPPGFDPAVAAAFFCEQPALTKGGGVAASSHGSDHRARAPPHTCARDPLSPSPSPSPSPSHLNPSILA